MSGISSLFRVLDFTATPAAWRYLLRTRKRSVASYRMCQAVRSLVGNQATVFDVGANQGQFAGGAAWWFPGCHIVSFEPSPSVFPILRKNTANIPNLELVQSALGDREGQLEFFENAYSHASSALPVDGTQIAMKPEVANVRKIVVPVTTLDRFSEGRIWPQPLLLKLDVQGFERKVLEGSTRFLGCADFLLFECSYRPMYQGEPLFAEMYEYVSGLGFKPVAPVGFLEDKDHVMLQTDLLWCRR